MKILRQSLFLKIVILIMLNFKINRGFVGIYLNLRRVKYE